MSEVKSKPRILLLTNPPWIRTGLAQNASVLLKYLWKTDKYTLAHYCSQVSEIDPQLALTPWKSYGALPSDPVSIQQLNQDPGKMRDATYGAWNIDKVIKDFRPDIFILSDDSWAAPKHAYLDKPWWKKINPILHITLDSYPILEQAFEHAENTPHYLTWAKFAQLEMKRRSPKYQHVGQIYGAMDTEQFSPITATEKADLRKRFGIAPTTTIFNYVFRNQLRKSANLILDGFAQFKRENPTADVKLHFHTSVSEKNQGWDFPKMMKHYGIPNTDVLFTYVCKDCHQWHVAPYVGEDVGCPYCKKEKSMITVNITNGVPPEEMRYVYGISDAAFSCATSGGQELTASQSMLCELPLACTNYSCGEDFCANPDVFPLSYHPYHEAGTNFIKAATDVKDIKRFIQKVWRMNPKDVKEWGKKSREWAKQTFSIDVIGKQWETLLDSLPMVNWDTIDLTPPPKNDQFPFPEIEDKDQFITSLYVNILKMDEPPQGEGRKNWHAQLERGMSRQSIYDFFIQTARTENARNSVKPMDFSEMLDKTGKKRGLMIAQQSIGDVAIITSLFKSFHEQHPNTDLYVMTEERYRPLLEGNPYVHKILAYNPAFEQEMLAIGAGQKSENALFDFYYHVTEQTQRMPLNYLSQPAPAFNLSY